MKKILFITIRNPYSGRYSGDVIRARRIIEYLKKKNDLDVVFLDDDKRSGFNSKNNVLFKYPNLLKKIYYCFKSFLNISPIQFGLFFSKDMSEFIKKNADNYEILFFHHIRSSQYLPKDFSGKTILEMGDLYSKNYLQTYKNLSFINPMKYIYLLESFLIKRVENKNFNEFDRIILFSKNEIKTISQNFQKKIFHITESVEKLNKNKFIFSKKNFKILFIGNLNYLPNKIACRDFAINILPKLNKEFPSLQFHIIGNISKYDQKILSKINNVKVLGARKKLDRFMKNVICGLSNLKIASGVQGKILTYMSFGLPVICSKQTGSNFHNYVISYKQDNDLIKKIISLKKSKSKSFFYSKKSKSCVKNLIWNKIKLNYLRVITFNKKLF